MMRPVVRVLLATTNAGKLAEFQALFDALSPGGMGRIQLVLLQDILPGYKAPVEDGETFLDNARIKAWAAAKASGMMALADDSGLCVDALGGNPGVWSARYAGEQACDADNKRKLLAELIGVPDERRTARFWCSLLLADPVRGVELGADGTCEGRIAHEERGAGGFGYDPLFVVEGEQQGAGQTMAELSPELKNQMSHRGRAVAALMAKAIEWLPD